MKELPKIYEPQKHEDEIYQNWEKSGFFNPDNLKGEPYSIMMPPPNVTGVLHLGHAMENSLMDIMARYQRMQGRKVLLLPGTDHAAVATQAKVEKLLMEKEGYRNPRQELGREKLLEKIKDFAENSKSTILNQIKKMGTSCDWSRLAYTFDETRSKAVNKVFEKMYTDGLIYRGYRVVNWSIKGQSTVSDDELVYIERPGKLYTFKYSKDFPFAIATTRPETKFGDTAVAVHPRDKRYQKYIGKIFEIKNFGEEKGTELKIKIIADEAVDPQFGTGAVGVTPAHSFTDFEMYEKQKAANNPIEIIPVIGPDGKMNEKAKSFQGISVQEAREKLIQWLKEKKLLEKEEDLLQNVATSDRFGDVVEILPMTQWFVAVNKEIPGRGKTLKQLMREAIAGGLNGNPAQKITVTPARFEKIYFNWIDNLRDWCISRQIWWGHRIPVYYCERGISNIQSSISPKEEKCSKPIVSSKIINKCPHCGGKIIQDPDTLDTWFSSGLWTFSTLANTPEQIKLENGKFIIDNKDFANFYPTDWMQMGSELLFFWMARMILMSAYVLDEIPFRDVYIHGILRNEKGQKFSKSLGNNIDPLDISHQYGTDALRLSLVSGIAPGQDSHFYEDKVKNAGNFVNKLWNISRYIIQKTKEQKEIEKIKKENLNSSDRWIAKKMNTLIGEVSTNIEKFNFSLASEKIQTFIRNDFADWYLEASKFEENKNEKSFLLKTILEDGLKLLHPFIPFVTEYIWKLLGKEKLLLIEKWPDKSIYKSLSKINDADDFELIKEIIIAIRNIRQENKIEPGKKINAIIYGGNFTKFIQENETLIKKLRTGVENLKLSKEGKEIKKAAKKIIAGKIQIYVPLEEIIDIEKQKKNTRAEIENLQKYISNLKIRLKNKDFLKKAPTEIVQKEKENLIRAQEKLKKLEKYSV